MAHVAHMQGKPERRRSLGPAVKQWGCAEMIVAFRPRPHGGRRDHVGKVERRDRRLPDIGIGMSGQAAEPGVDGIDRLDHDAEIAGLDDLFDQPQLFVGAAGVLVPDGDGRRDIGHPGHVGAEFLQGHVRVGGLVRRIGIHERRLLVGHHLLDDRRDALALGEPLPPDLRQQPGRVGLVHKDGAGGPSVGKGQPVHLVEQAGCGGARKAGDRQKPEMLIAQSGFQAAGQRLIGQQRIEIDRSFGHADAMPVGRNRRVEVGQRAGVIEPSALGHEAVEQRQHAVGAVDEAAHQFPGVHARGLAPFIQPGLGTCGIFGGREPQEGQEVARDEMAALLLEIGLPLGIDQRRGRIGEAACGIACGFRPLCFDKDGPAGAETAEGVVQPPGHRDQLGRDGGIQIGTTELRRALERAVLVQHDAGADQRHPGKVVGKA